MRCCCEHGVWRRASVVVFAAVSFPEFPESYGYSIPLDHAVRGCTVSMRAHPLDGGMKVDAKRGSGEIETSWSPSGKRKGVV